MGNKMGNKQDSNVIHVDFRERKAHEVSDETQAFSQLVDDIISPIENTTEESPEEWLEEISPKERSEQLKRDLEFLQQMNDIPPATKY
jgi:hypothetical protein